MRKKSRGISNVLAALLLGTVCLFAGCTAPAEHTEPAEETSEPQAEAVLEESGELTASLEAADTWEENGKSVTRYVLVISNEGDAAIKDWKAELTVPEGTTVKDSWNLRISESDTGWVLEPMEYNRTLEGHTEYTDAGFIAICESDEVITLLTLQAGDLKAGTVSEKTPKEIPEPAVRKETAEASGALHIEDGSLVNEKGEAVQLRGVSTHGLAWFPEYVNEDAFRTLRDEWNVNTIRLAMYTAESGGYCTDGKPEELKQLIAKGVDAADDLGMYVIIDWHILSDSDPCMHEEEAAAFFDEMSEKYADRTNVIYEICNEPQNSPYETVIRPYAEHMLSIIRNNDSDALVLVGTNTWSQDIDEVIGNMIDDDHVMYTLHFYAATHKDSLREKLKKALDAGVPVYISECSICDASGNGGIDEASAAEWYALIEEYGLSWNAWSLCNKNETSALIRPSCRELSGWKEEDLSETGRWFQKAFLRG
ncbi:MAG: cellulase family glycosylhydrolase [Solobacterium sp.]|nr:cellulase family glycosylhydrolase [Solobacterium sp.]